MKKSTKILLTAGAALAVLVSASSCGNRRAKKEAEAERARKEAAAAQKAADDAAKTLELQINKEKKAVYDHARDSVLDANGYDRAVWNQLDAAQSKLYELDNLSQKTILCQRVDTLVAKQVRQSANEIESLLAKYKIWVDDKEDLFSKVESEYFDHVNNREIAKNNAEEYDEAEKAEMLAPELPYNFFGNSAGNSRYDYEKYVVDWNDSEYGESRQKEIENGVLKIFGKMNQALDNAIAAEVKKFAVYYPELDIEKSGMPAEYRKYHNIDFTLYNYDDGYRFEYVQPKLVVERGVSVYDSKLKVDFFGEEDATYKLVKVSEGQWQVVRTDKNGHVAKTPVFSHNVDYGYAIYSYGKDDTIQDSFRFEPGANMGVHVTVREVVWSKTGKDDRYPDPKGQIAAKRDSVAKEVARLEVLNDRMREISHQADSVAKIKQQQYMARRFNKR